MSLRLPDAHIFRARPAPKSQAEAGSLPDEPHSVVDHQEGPYGNLLGIGGDRAGHQLVIDDAADEVLENLHSEEPASAAPITETKGRIAWIIQDRHWNLIALSIDGAKWRIRHVNIAPILDAHLRYFEWTSGRYLHASTLIEALRIEIIRILPMPRIATGGRMRSEDMSLRGVTGDL
jgi:hypothetical protein